MKRLKWLSDKKLIRKHDWSRTFLSGKFIRIIRCDSGHYANALVHDVQL